ncbi:MAG TPA: hypothetical protein VM266_10490 [Solirubrobacteraceae bacterium]|nr:hypothetical protein [Solirubrobacteraceae bacterium]
MTPSVQIAGGRRVTRWTREAIIEKIREWHERHGEAPCSADWNPSLARWRAQEWRVERYRDGRWPSTNAVKRAFGGSFDAAVRAAGLSPARPGPRRAAGAARPAVPPRAPRPPREVDDELTAAAERVRRAEARAEALRVRLEAAEAAARAARRAAAQAEAAREDADARARAALDQADAALRDARPPAGWGPAPSGAITKPSARASARVIADPCCSVGVASSAPSAAVARVAVR